MHKIIKYQTVVSQGESNAWLDAAVSTALLTGWQPFGSAYLNADRHPCQAMVKYDEVVTVTNVMNVAGQSMETK